MATENGLIRFDGNKFDYYFHNEKDSNTILNNFVYQITEDSKELLCVGSSCFIQLYNHCIVIFDYLSFTNSYNAVFFPHLAYIC